MSHIDWGSKGVEFRKSGNYSEAIKCYKKAIELNPKYSFAYNNLGNVYKKQKNYSEAIKCYKKAIELNPKYSFAYFNLGFVYKDQKNYSEAIKCYKKAIELDPKDSTAYNNLGIVYEYQKNYSEAIKCYKKAIELNPKYSFAYKNLGIIYKKQKNYFLAKEMFVKAVNLNPNSENYKKQLSIVNEKLKNSNFEEEELRKKIEKEMKEKMKKELEKKEEKMKEKMKMELEKKEEEIRKLKAQNDLKKKITMKDMDKYKIPAADITLIKKIGGGGFGVCYLSTWNGDGGGVDVVVKVIELVQNVTSKQVFSEILFHLNLISPAVCRVYGFSIVSSEKIYIVMEKMDSDLSTYLKKKRPNFLEKIKLLIKMTKCVKVLHSKNIIHKDIKCANFLIDGSLNVKITDFGISTVMTHSKTHVTTGGKGTLPFMSPELFTENSKFSKGSDIYALGCSFYEIIFEEIPFSVMLQILIVMKMGKKYPKRLETPPNTVPKKLIELMKSCLHPDPKERPEPFEIIRKLSKM